MPTLEVATIKQAIADELVGVDGLAGASAKEPKKLPDIPWASVMTAGFVRRSIDTNVVRSPVVDPLGGRTWIWQFNLRLWVSLKTDEGAAQDQLDVLTKRVVVALENNPTLGIGLDDLSVSSGLAGVVNDQSGPAMMVMDMSCEVEWTEQRN